MRPVSPEFLRVVRGSHQIDFRARVCAPGQTGTDPDGEEIAVTGGDVTLDANSDVRGTIDLTTDGNGAWPDMPTGLLAPYGNELFVERGIRYGSGSTEWCSLGYFRIYGTEQSGNTNSPIRITGKDRMSALIDAKLLEPRQFRSNWVMGAIFDVLVREVLPDAAAVLDNDFEFSPIGRDTVAEEDRFAFLLDLVRARGRIMYWDHRGVLRVKHAPTASGEQPIGTVTGQGTSLWGGYIIGTDADAQDIPIGALARLYDSAGNLKESGTVRVWDKQSAAGFTNVFFRPDATVSTVAGDQLVAFESYEPWTVNTGKDGVLVELSRSLSREGIFNAVVATGEAPDDGEPVRAVAFDNNPASPTYWDGPFGKVPRPYSSPAIITTAQAETAARAMLNKSLGLPYNIDFTAVPNPALEPYDPVKISYPGGYTYHVIERITIPLAAQNPMTATTRLRIENEET